jgi:hypothetical protein
MLNKMNILLAATAAVALSAGAAIAQPDRHDSPNLSVTVGDQGQAGYYGNGYNYGYDDGYARRDRDAHYRSETWRAQPASMISVGLGGIAFGYADGYWDNGHTWHRWNSRRDLRAYRDRSGSHYYHHDHDRYSNDGWQR